MVTWRDRQSPRVPTGALPPRQAPGPLTLTPSQTPPRLPFPGRAGRRRPPLTPQTGGGGSCGPDVQSREEATRRGTEVGGGSSATLVCPGSFMSQPSPDPARASSWAGSRPLLQPLPAVFGVGLGSWRTAAGQGAGLATASSISPPSELVWGQGPGQSVAPPLVPEHLTPRLKI